MWLDEDEFDGAVGSHLLDAATAKRVLNERTLIEMQLSAGEWPPPVARDMDIVQVRELLQV
jgi:hypothetical protein